MSVGRLRIDLVPFDEEPFDGFFTDLTAEDCNAVPLALADQLTQARVSRRSEFIIP